MIANIKDMYYIVIHDKPDATAMKSTITVRLDEELEDLLEKVARESGRSRSELIREALRRQLSLESFQQLRKKILPFAEAQGLLTDEDVWKEIS